MISFLIVLLSLLCCYRCPLMYVLGSFFSLQFRCLNFTKHGLVLWHLQIWYTIREHFHVSFKGEQGQKALDHPVLLRQAIIREIGQKWPQATFSQNQHTYVMPVPEVGGFFLLQVSSFTTKITCCFWSSDSILTETRIHTTFIFI